MRRNGRAQSRVIRPGGSYGPICDETVWSIAKKLVENTPFSVYQGIAAIAHKNPGAFKYGNINYFFESTVLELPTPQELASISKHEAQFFVETQNQEWQKGHQREIQEPKVVSKPSKALRLVVPEENEPERKPFDVVMMEEQLDTLKRSNESLFNLLSQKDSEIQKLKKAMELKHATPVPHKIEDFAVAIPDVKRALPEGFPITQEHEVPPKPNVQPSEAEKPIPQATIMSVEPAVSHAEPLSSQPSSSVSPSVSFVPPAEDLNFKPKTHSVKFVIFWLIFIFILIFSLSIGLWVGREQLFAFFKKYKEKIYPSSSVILKEQLTSDAANLVSASEHLHFDLEKALTALNQEEKRYINLQNTKDSALAENTSLEDVDVYIAYERYAQAEKILQNILTKTPQHWEALLKLLELYVLTENYEDFERYYVTVAADLNYVAPRIWSRIELLKSKVENEKSVKIVGAEGVSKDETKEQGVVKKPSLTLGKVDPSAHSRRRTQMDSLLPEVSEQEAEPAQPTPPAQAEGSPAPSETVVTENKDIESCITLAQAYIDIGDYESAREFLMKASREGSISQKRKANELLDSLPKSK